MGYLTVSQLHPLFIFNIVTNTLQNPRSKRELFLFMDVHDRMFTQLTILIAFQYCSPKFLFLLCAFGRVESDWIPRIDAAIVIRGRLLLLSGHNNSVADRSRNRVFRDCNSFLVPTETVALPGNIFGGLYVPGKYGKRVHIPFATRQKKKKPKKTITIQWNT